ncbi:MAG: type II toxin-antitoxin system VapC family toxin [Mycobacteriales bacterium]
MRVYLDTSALVKLVQIESESEALRRYLRDRPGEALVSSALARVELVRAVSTGGQPAVAHARRLLDRLYLVDLDPYLLDQAADLAPATPLRSLDAIHLAAAQLVRPLRAVVTYDERMLVAAHHLQLPTATPR